MKSLSLNESHGKVKGSIRSGKAAFPVAVLLLFMLGICGAAYAGNQTVPANTDGYSAIKTAINLFGEYHVTYLSQGMFTSKDIAGELNHYATICSLVRNSKHEDEISRFIAMADELKKTRLDESKKQLTEEEAQKLVAWGVLTEKEYTDLAYDLIKECSVAPYSFQYFPAAQVHSEPAKPTSAAAKRNYASK